MYLLSQLALKKTKKGRISLGGVYATGRRRHVRPYKIYIFLISATTTIDLAMSIRLSVMTRQLLHRHAVYVRTERN